MATKVRGETVVTPNFLRAPFSSSSSSSSSSFAYPPTSCLIVVSIQRTSLQFHQWRRKCSDMGTTSSGVARSFGGVLSSCESTFSGVYWISPQSITRRNGQVPERCHKPSCDALRLSRGYPRNAIQRLSIGFGTRNRMESGQVAQIGSQSRSRSDVLATLFGSNKQCLDDLTRRRRLH